MCPDLFAWVIAAFLVGYVLSMVFAVLLIPPLLDRLTAKIEQRRENGS